MDIISNPVIFNIESKNGTEKKAMILDITSPELIIPNTFFPWLRLNILDANPQKQMFFTNKKGETHANSNKDSHILL